MTEQPGWESPSGLPGEPPAPPRPPLSSGWAADQPPGAEQPYGSSPAGYGQHPAAQPPPHGGQPTGWGPQPGYGGPAGWGQPQWLPPKPGVIPLRPLGVGEILDGAISTIRAKPRLMLGLSAIVAVLTQVVTVPVSWVLLHDAGDEAFSFDQSSTGGEGSIAFTASSATASVLQVVVTLVATLLLTGILTVVLSRAVLGQDIDGQQAWAQTRPRLPALVGVLIIVFLIEIGVAVLLLGPGIALAVSGAPGVAIALALVAGIPLFVCVSVYLYVAFALAPAVVVLEKQSVIDSLNRSRRLIKGAWWRTFGIVVLVNVIAAIVNGILSGIFSIGALLAAGAASGFDSANPYELVPLIITAVGTIIGATISWPFTAVATALIYVDRRIRREGLDLELARAAGFTPPDTSATPGTPLDGPVAGGPYSGGSRPAGEPPPPYGG